MSQEGTEYKEYNRMDCEIILEKTQMDLDANNSSVAGTSGSKESFVAAKIKRSKSLDNVLLLKNSQDLITNSSTLEFPSMLSRFRELQFNE